MLRRAMMTSRDSLLAVAAGLPWRGRATLAAHAWKAVVRQHHKELRPVLAPHVPSDAVVIDAGSHAGQFAKLFAAMAPHGRVVAFEPSSYARAILRLAAARRPNIEIVPKALGDRAGTLTLAAPIKGGSVRFGLAHLGGTDERAKVRRETVEVVTLDDFADGHGIGRLDFLKADIEGWEMRLLAGGARTIQRYRPAMLLELIDTFLRRAGDSLDGAWTVLSDWGYRPMAVRGGTLTALEGPADGDSLWFPEGRRAL